MALHRFAGLMGIVFLVAGCATVINRSTQAISITTGPVVGATCDLSNGVGTWYIRSPGSITIRKTKNGLTVHCKKDGFQEVTQTIEPHFSGATFGNIIAGGVIGVGVDAA